jgi:nicotinate phosphoribosyltransferase
VEAGRDYRFYHPRYPYKFMDVTGAKRVQTLLEPVMLGGKIVMESLDLQALQGRALANLRSLDHTYRRILNPHVYKVSLSEALKDLKFRLIAEFTGKEAGS